MEIPPSILNNNDMKGVMNVGKNILEHGAVECKICAASSLDDEQKPMTHSRTRAKSQDCSQHECEDTLLKKAICWRCLILKVMEGGTMQDIFCLKSECHRRRLRLRLLMKIAKCKHGADEVPDAFWQCIYVMFNWESPSQKYIKAHASHLFKLIGEENSRDIFPIERAKMSYITSLFVLNHCRHKNKRSSGPLSNLHLPDVVSWLLSAFIISRESPLLFQKVSQLLALMLISKQRSFPHPLFSGSSLSIDHWVAYFHQASIGTYIPAQYLAWKGPTIDSENTEDRTTFSFLILPVLLTLPVQSSTRCVGGDQSWRCYLCSSFSFGC
ncbi:separase [Iris pallida]|uniref:Separase n=1 Tax=Iris pallida TaxID=29817 RepID=A0AAX6I2K4_IRIPA|nr:separase [Iris pallida]